MESTHVQNDSLTPSQWEAVTARGNVLVMAGAGTGKTHTLVERCLNCLSQESPPASLDEMLIVTFTDAAAAEVRQRIRRELEKLISAQPDSEHWTRQLALFDTAPIGTLHSFCLRLVREHFYELGLDPQLAVLDTGEARLLAEETLDELFQAHYAGQADLSVAAQNLIQIYGNGDEHPIRALLLRLHHYAQTRPDHDRWVAEQITRFATPEPVEWREWLGQATQDWREEWLPALDSLKTGNEKAAELLTILSRLGSARASRAIRRALAPNTNAADQTNGRQTLSPKANDEGVVGGTRGACAPPSNLEFAAEVLQQIVAADANWPTGRNTVLRKPLEDFFTDAAFLHSLVTNENGRAPLDEDWDWVRGHMIALLRLAQEFGQQFAERKRADGVLDFHDLEQFALKLLWDSATDKPTSIAGQWRKKIRLVFVDEYQDINAAQDKIIQTLSRESADANRFLVGDVKQSIYRFRLAEPTIFRDYARSWHGENGRVIPLTENFRSRESLLGFVNSVFEVLMREEVGGVEYDTNARLQFGAPEQRTPLGLAHDPSPRVELLLRIKNGRNNDATEDESDNGGLAGLEEAEKEARLVALRLRELVAQGHEIWDEKKGVKRPAEWQDMAVLLRAPSGKSGAYAKAFERVGVPLVVERGGFYESTEIADLLSLLRLLDNPLQDIPAIAVLRSPLVGLSLDELATVRLAAKDVHFWTALNRVQSSKLKVQSETAAKISKFLEQFSRWRQLARQASLSQCLESVLAETHYAEWLHSRPRGAQRQANVARFLGLTQQFDQFQRQGLFRFLKFIEAQQTAEAEPEVAPVAGENAVRLMSIHQSKGLEFPIVVVADLAKAFNERDLRGEIIFDEQFGLCPRVKPPHTGRRYPSLPHWLAQRHQRREQRGEELRLLYVAMTRARDTLILTATVSEKKRESFGMKPEAIGTQGILSAKSYSDWLGLWFGVQSPMAKDQSATEGELPHLRWRVVEDEELAGESEPEKWKPEIGSPVLDEKTAQRLGNVLTWEYPFDAATRRAAKSSVTALRRQAEELDNEAKPMFQPSRRLRLNPKSEIRNPRLTAAATGTAHHKFLQHVTLEKADDLAALKVEAKRLETAGILTTDESTGLDLEALAAFWQSEPGRKIRAQPPACVRRELPFTVKFNPAEVDAIIGANSPQQLEHEFVVVQGVADLIVLLLKEIWLVDFKTDEIKPAELAERQQHYEPQLKLYAGALSRIYSRPVINCWLHFLATRQTVNIRL
ncbi:MAG TPA: UvrD-helicase domain-containing protein [Candidatus Saccharimonadales bacterium]|nr:UvrD-helicase domain-containing protein [Candidatus Saccharimonadales bacterium]